MTSKSLFFCFIITCGFAGKVVCQTDTLSAPETLESLKVTGEVRDVNPKSPEVHSPKKAATLSAIFPGAGQIYNRKYWKLPIIYGGFAVAGYYLSDNLKQIDTYKTAYQAATDDDPNTENTTGFNNSQLLDLIDQYKTWRDWSYIALGAIYILNIIDASVDAHLFYFDVSDDLSLHITPYAIPFGQPSTGLALTLKL